MTILYCTNILKINYDNNFKSKIKRNINCSKCIIKKLNRYLKKYFNDEIFNPEWTLSYDNCTTILIFQLVLVLH